MTRAEAKRWAHDAVAGLLRADWDSADWGEKYGKDGERLDAAVREIIDYHAARGPRLGDATPHVPDVEEGR